jgi:cystathionine beta-lyase
MADKKLKQDTVLARAGNRPTEHKGIVNPPVYHASTVLFPTVAALEDGVRNRFRGVYYGRYGTPTTFALEEAVAAIENCPYGFAVPSGLAAITMPVATFVRPGDHVLAVDNAYDPVRGFADRFLQPYGIEVTYFDPLAPDALPSLIRSNTKLLYLETPGSLTFEVPDIPALAQHGRNHGLVVVVDNTWATGLHFKPIEHGADISIYAATKYLAGHSDLMLGMIVCRDEAHYRAIKTFAHGLGMAAAPDDCYLTLRGIRTLSVRLERHLKNSLRLAEWLRGRKEVARILHPAFPGSPGHEIWRRDFTGGGGVFSIVLRPATAEAVAAMLEGLTLFGMGFSWGGYESLAIPVDPAKCRSATPWDEPGPLLRIQTGLEDPDDLIADLAQGFERLNRANAP